MKTAPIASKTMNVLLWMAQGLLAATFMWAGIMKLFEPQNLPFPWVKDNPALVVVTGIVDLLGGVGILLPALIRFRPKLTLLAAYGILILMIVASIFHISRGEGKDIGFNMIMAAVAAFVIWCRKSHKVNA